MGVLAAESKAIRRLIPHRQVAFEGLWLLMRVFIASQTRHADLGGTAESPLLPFRHVPPAKRGGGVGGAGQTWIAPALSSLRHR